MRKWLIRKLLNGYTKQEISELFWPYMINHNNEAIKYNPKMVREAAEQGSQMHRAIRAV